jgi:hypothetical protein
VGSAGSLRFLDGGAGAGAGAADTTAGEEDSDDFGLWLGSCSLSESEDTPYGTRTAVRVRFIDREKSKPSLAPWAASIRPARTARSGRFSSADTPT